MLSRNYYYLIIINICQNIYTSNHQLLSRFNINILNARESIVFPYGPRDRSSILMLAIRKTQKMLIDAFLLKHLAL